MSLKFREEFWDRNNLKVINIQSQETGRYHLGSKRGELRANKIQHLASER